VHFRAQHADVAFADIAGAALGRRRPRRQGSVTPSVHIIPAVPNRIISPQNRL
jgi:hypothetical protein